MKNNTLIAIFMIEFMAVIAFVMAVIAFGIYLSRDEPEIKVFQPEYNHMVIQDDCKIVTDTLGNVNCIWYKNMPYTLDTTIFNNL